MKTRTTVDGKTISQADYIKSAEAARILGCSVPTLRKMCESGEVNCITTPGKHRFFDVKEIKIMARNKKEGNMTAAKTSEGVVDVLEVNENEVVSNELLKEKLEKFLKGRIDEDKFIITTEFLKHDIERQSLPYVSLNLFRPEGKLTVLRATYAHNGELFRYFIGELTPNATWFSYFQSNSGTISDILKYLDKYLSNTFSIKRKETSVLEIDYGSKSRSLREEAIAANKLLFEQLDKNFSGNKTGVELKVHEKLLSHEYGEKINQFVVGITFNDAPLFMGKYDGNGYYYYRLQLFDKSEGSYDVQQFEKCDSWEFNFVEKDILSVVLNRISSYIAKTNFIDEEEIKTQQMREKIQLLYKRKVDGHQLMVDKLEQLFAGDRTPLDFKVCGDFVIDGFFNTTIGIALLKRSFHEPSDRLVPVALIKCIGDNSYKFKTVRQMTASSEQCEKLGYISGFEEQSEYGNIDKVLDQIAHHVAFGI